MKQRTIQTLGHILGVGLFLAAGTLSAQNPVYGGIAAGAKHNLAFQTNGLTRTAGFNSAGQLGNGDQTNRAFFTTPVAGLSNVIALEGGDTHSLVLREDGQVFSFGENSYGRLGDGTATDHKTPVAVTNLTGVIAIAAGGAHSLALKSSGLVFAWGAGTFGRLGDGTSTTRKEPTQVTNLTSASAIAAGDAHSLALSNGVVWSWGEGSYGRLGNGSTADQSSPVQVTGLSNVVAIAAGGSHSLALKSDSTVWSWGFNSHGQLGDSTTSQRTTPVQVTNLSGVIAIAAGNQHSLALLSNGLVRSWGYNNSGFLGDNSTTTRKTNVAVVNLSNVVAIAAGDSHSLALCSDGSIWAWGTRADSQLADLSTNSYSMVPVPTVTAIQLEADPLNQTVNQGSTAIFSLTAIGTEPLTYQWRWNGSDVSEETNAALTLENVQPYQAGNYGATVSNAVGSVTSSAAALTVRTPPSITGQPTNLAVAVGSNATFNVSATGWTPLSYQWRFNGTNIAGATVSSYTKSNAQLTDAGNYDVVVTNIVGSVTSSPAVLAVMFAPVITNQPQSQTITQGDSVTFSVVAGGTEPLSYQWSVNGTSLAEATASSLVLTNVQVAQGGYYAVQVTNGVGSILSSTAALNVVQVVTNPLINVDFAADPIRTNKVGFAAVGQTADDIWNEDWTPGQFSSSLTDLQRADGTYTSAELTIENAPGACDFFGPGNRMETGPDLPEMQPNTPPRHWP